MKAVEEALLGLALAVLGLIVVAVLSRYFL
jgi:hypothetical protein